MLLVGVDGGGRGLEARKEPQQMRPERWVAHLGRERHRTWGSSAGLAATSHKGKTEEKAGGDVESIFSQKTQLKAVMG